MAVEPAASTCRVKSYRVPAFLSWLSSAMVGLATWVLLASQALSAEFVFSGGLSGRITTNPPSAITGTYSFAATGPSTQSLDAIPNGLSFFSQVPDVVWNLDSTFTANISAPGFRYRLRIAGNNGSGGSFGAFFDQYTFDFPGATGTGTIDDPLDQLTAESTMAGRTTFLQRRTNETVPPGLPAGIECRAHSTGAIANNCLRWSSLSPAISGSGTVNFRANSGRNREGFLFTIMSEADIRVSKTVADGLLSPGESSSFEITVEHLGDAQQSAAIDLRIQESLPASIIAGPPTFTSTGGFRGTPAYSGGVLHIDTLDFGQTLTMTLPFTLSTDAVPGATVTNTIDPASITMVQTDPNDNHGPLSASFLVASPGLFLEKTGLLDIGSDGVANVGDRITYTFRVKNTSDVPLQNVQLSDPLLLGPNGTLVGGAIDSLAPGTVDSTTFTGTYSLTQADIDAGQVINSATVSGMDPGGATVSDVSDDPSNPRNVDPDGDGNPDDPTVTAIVSYPSLIDAIGDDLTAILEDDRATTIALQSRQARDFAAGALDRLRDHSGHECEAAVNRYLNARPILFDTDKAIIKPENGPVLDDIARILRTCERRAFEIAGHTDSDASDAYNLVLSKRRVEAVLRALGARGVDTSGYRTQGYGESRPIDTNATAQGKARNRRVAFILLEDQARFDNCKGEADLDRTFSLRADGSTVSADGGLVHQSHNCAKGVWQTFAGSLNYLELDRGLSQALLNLSYRKEWFANSDNVLGYFVGLYGSNSHITRRADGDIDGYGFNAGLYGANRLNTGLYVDYYLGGAAGRHDFDLAFNRSIGTIRATGDYTYIAGFAGVALSGEIDRETYRYVPRAGIDYAYAPSSDVDVIARLNGISQSGLAGLTSLRNTRLFTEVRVERDINDGAALLAFTPVLACYGSNGDVDSACGIGAELAFESFNETANDWQHSLRLSAERGDGYSILSFAAEVSKQLGAGQVGARADVDEGGNVSLNGSYELAF